MSASAFPLLMGPAHTRGAALAQLAGGRPTEKAQPPPTRQRPPSPFPTHTSLPIGLRAHTPLPHWSQLPITSHFSTPYGPEGGEAGLGPPGPMSMACPTPNQGR